MARKDDEGRRLADLATRHADEASKYAEDGKCSSALIPLLRAERTLGSAMTSALAKGEAGDMYNARAAVSRATAQFTNSCDLRARGEREMGNYSGFFLDRKLRKAADEIARAGQAAAKSGKCDEASKLLREAERIASGIKKKKNGNLDAVIAYAREMASERCSLSGYAKKSRRKKRRR